MVGASLGRTAFNSTLDQDNLFAENGPNITTNAWNNPAGFAQYGERTGLEQEDGLQTIAGVPQADPFSNHYMFKLTDLLALGALMEKLDPTMTADKLNALIRLGSFDMKGSYEGVLDGLRKVLQGSGVALTPAADVSGNDASRLTYHSNLKALSGAGAFASLQGKLVIKAASADLRASARNNFGALVALQDLSPVVISGVNTAAETLLISVWQSTRAAD